MSYIKIILQYTFNVNISTKFEILVQRIDQETNEELRKVY